MDECFNRIVELMKEQNVSYAEIERITNSARGTFSNWKRGKGKLYYSYIDVIADRLGVSIDYLIRGTQTHGDSLQKDEANLVEYYRGMSTKGKQVLLASAKLMFRGDNSTG